MQVVQIGLLKPDVQEPRHELTPQVKPLPKQEAHEEETPWPMRQLETQVALPAPGTPKQRPPQLCSLGLLSNRQCPQTWKIRMLNNVT